MKATISVDHRVSDGAEAAQFMQALGQDAGVRKTQNSEVLKTSEFFYAIFRL